MEGVLPLGLQLSDDSARIVGAYVRLGLVAVVRPPLDAIAAGVQTIATLLSLMTVAVVDSVGTLQYARLRVEESNESMLDDITATRWAVAYFSYNTFLELLDLVRGMAWLDGRSHIHLHDIIAAVGSLEGAVAAFAAQVNLIGAFVVTLLQAILDQLRQGIGLFGTITIVVQAGGLGDFLASLDLWKLLGLLALVTAGLAVIVGFLYLVAGALAAFGAGSIQAAIAIGILVAALIPLMNALAGFDWEQLAKIALGFAGIAGFVALLGKAFALFTTDLEKIVPPLQTFFTAIRELMTAIAGFGWADLAKIAAGFAGITVFVAALGRAFALFSTDLEKVVPHLRTFFTAIGELMRTLAAFTPGDLVKIAVGLALVAGFVWALGRALSTLTQRALDAMDPLARFLASMREMLTALAGFSVGQLFTIAAAFLLIAGFVYLLGQALNTFTVQAVIALPGLAQLLGALGQLAQLMAAMSVGELITMGVGLALVAAFVWAVAAALVYAAGPLASLAKIMEHAASAVGALGDALGWVGDRLSDIGGLAGDAWDAISSPIDFSSLLGAAVPGMPSAATLAPAMAGPPQPAAGPGTLATLAGGPGGGPLAAAGGGVGSVDQSVTLSGLTVNLNAERLEAGAGELLTDEVVAALQARLGDLRATQDFRVGARPEQS